MKIPILRLRDKDGKEIAIPAIRGPRGLAGDGTGDMVANVYDPTGQAKDIFQFAQDAASEAKKEAKKEADNTYAPKEHTHSAEDVSLKTEVWTFTLEDGSTVTKVVYVG
jgi:hypothetical protein